MRPRDVEPAGAARFVAGALLLGYGGLVVLRFLAHESWLVGAALVVAGAVLVASARGTWAPAARERAASWSPRRVLLAVVGAALAGGVLAYNFAARSSLTSPELAIVAYGAALMAAAWWFDRSVGGARVAALAGWSFPIVAAPLALYALDALVDAQAGVGRSPLDWFLQHALVAPSAWLLAAIGFDVSTVGQTLGLETPRGMLFLSVGVVCSGLEPGILFVGVFALYAWRTDASPRRLAGLVLLGLVGVYVANLVRIMALAAVGYVWGGQALQQAHAHLGWLLFTGWMFAYWWLVLRRLHGGRRIATPGA